MKLKIGSKMHKRMDKELRDIWVDALRSGQYKQGKLKLKDTKTNTYCCLGVGADAFGILNKDGRIYREDGFRLSSYSWAHVPVLKEEVPFPIQSYLMACNDGEFMDEGGKVIGLPEDFEHPRGFEEIADFIERYI